jgi:hypothetical protein
MLFEKAILSGREEFLRGKAADARPISIFFFAIFVVENVNRGSKDRKQVSRKAAGAVGGFATVRWNLPDRCGAFICRIIAQD